MPRVSLQTAYDLRVRCHKLRDEGQSLRQIAAVLGLSLGSVRNYLASPVSSVSPDDFLATCIEIKQDRVWLGATPIADLATKALGLPHQPVSSGLVDRVLKAADLVVPVAESVKRPFWTDNYSAPNKVWQLDTAKLTASDGTQYEFLIVLDMRSRASWAVYLPHSGLECYALIQCFEVLGIPEVITSDNGMGWPPNAQGELSNVITCAFRYGVKRFQFIPPSKPELNGGVERRNKSLKHRDWLYRARYQCKTANDVVKFAYNSVREHNEVFSSRPLGGRGKHNRVTPAQAHGDLYNPRENALPYPVTYDKVTRLTTAGTVSFVRRVTNNNHSFVGAPAIAFALDRTVGAWYLIT